MSRPVSQRLREENRANRPSVVPEQAALRRAGRLRPASQPWTGGARTRGGGLLRAAVPGPRPRCRADSRSQPGPLPRSRSVPHAALARVPRPDRPRRARDHVDGRVPRAPDLHPAGGQDAARPRRRVRPRPRQPVTGQRTAVAARRRAAARGHRAPPHHPRPPRGSGRREGMAQADVAPLVRIPADAGPRGAQDSPVVDGLGVLGRRHRSGFRRRTATHPHGPVGGGSRGLPAAHRGQGSGTHRGHGQRGHPAEGDRYVAGSGGQAAHRTRRGARPGRQTRAGRARRSG